MPTYSTRNGNGVMHVLDADQRGYREPPPPPAPFEPPSVQAGVPTFSGTQLQQAHAAILHASKEFQRHINATDEQRHHYTPEGYRDQIARFQSTAAARSVDAALESVAARRDSAAAKVDKIRRDLSPDGNEAVELRALRYRDRVIRQLDAAKDGGAAFKLAQDLLAGATREELGTLLQELPSLLNSRGIPSDWVDPSLARIIPEYGTARAQLKQAESAYQITRMNVEFMRRGFADGRAPTVLTDPGKYDPDI
jgi:hypothetical protein